MPALPNELDPYRHPTPYDILDVPLDASAAEIRDKHTRLKRDVQASGLSAVERSKKLQILDEAYDELRVASKRVRVDFMLLDGQLGKKQCEAIAKTVDKPNTNVDDDIVKRRTVRVTHETLLDELSDFIGTPEKVIGLHVKRIESAEAASLPEPLAIQFDS